MTTVASTTAQHDPRQLDAVRKSIKALAGRLNAQVNVRLWDGSLEPLGENVTSPLEISISGPGVIGAILRWPTHSRKRTRIGGPKISSSSTASVTARSA